MHSNFIRTARAKGPASARGGVAPRLEASTTAGCVADGAVGHFIHYLRSGDRNRVLVAGPGQAHRQWCGQPDYTLVLGLVVLITVLTVTLNLLVDLACAWLDPKIRY